MKNKIVSLILAVILIVSLLPVTAFAAGDITDEHGIITSPAEGTIVTYKRPDRTNTSFYLSGQTLYLGYQSGTATMVQCADGTVYWLNPISRFTTGKWIKGEISGSAIVFPTEQPVLYNADYNATLSVCWGYYDGNYNWTKTDEKGDSFIFDIVNDDTLVLRDSEAIFDYGSVCYFPGIFWDDDDSFNGYGDCGVKLLKAPLFSIDNGTPAEEKSSNGGFISVNKEVAIEGETVTVSVFPNDNYLIESLSYVGEGDAEPTLITRSLIGSYLFPMPAENVTVCAIFQPGPAVFVTADKEHPVSDASTFEYYVEGTTWKGYTFAGWFYDNNGTETEFTESFDQAQRGVTYTARWKNAAGNFVLTDGITVSENGVYIGEDSVYATAGTTDKGGPKRYVDGIGGANNDLYRLVQSPEAIKLQDSSVSPFDMIISDTAAVDAAAGENKLEKYGITFTKAQNGEPATLTLSGASIEAGDGIDTYYAYGSMFEIYAGIFSTVPLKLVLSGDNSVCITRNVDYDCACGIFGGDNASLTVIGDKLNVDASSAAGIQTGGIILNGGALTNSATVQAVGGRGINSSYGISCGYLTNTAGELTGRAGSGAYYCDGLNLNVPGVISGGKVAGYGGSGSVEYYGLWTNQSLTVSQNGILEVYGGTQTDSSTKEALYLENELAVIELTGYGKIVADSSVKNAGSYKEAYPVSGADSASAEGKNTILTRSGSDPILITVPEEKPLWIGSTQVTLSNKDNVLGDATASFDPITCTLTLSNAAISVEGEASGFPIVSSRSDNSKSGIKSNFDDLTIKLFGTNQIGKNNNGQTEKNAFSIDNGIYSSGDLTFIGDGTLNIYDYCDGIIGSNVTFAENFTGTLNVWDYGNTEEPQPCAIHASEAAFFNNGKINLTSINKEGIYAGNIVSIKNAVVTITSSMDGIRAGKDIRIENSTVDITSNDDGIYSSDTTIYIIDSNVTITSNEEGLDADYAVIISNSAVKVKGGMSKSAVIAWIDDIHLDDTLEIINGIMQKTGTTSLVPADENVNGGYVTIRPKQDPAPVYPVYSEPIYQITVSENTENGSIKLSRRSAFAGNTITVTVTPDKGYTLETLAVVDADGNEIVLKDLGDNKFSFRMPAGKVSISASFMEENTILNFCIDVKADDYFYDAVLWAYVNGISNGIDELHFNPFGITSRAEMVTFMWRAAGSPEPSLTECPFTDVKPGDFFYKAVLWAVENKITKGTSPTTFAPTMKVSRCQAVTLLARMDGVQDDAAGYTLEFTDVRAGDYFFNAVAWAYKNKITEGTGGGMFSPDDDCLRNQAVTFLYRDFAE